MILAGDVGGTKTILSLYRVEGARLHEMRTATYPSNDFPGLPAMAETFLGSQTEGIDAACFGIPGPIVGGRAKAVNLAWEVDAIEIATRLRILVVELVNDLYATATGVFALQPSELLTLQPGSPVEAGSAALVAPGTGLGMGVLARVGGKLVPLPSEGGHQDFAPRNETEIGLLRHLQQKLGGRVSVERVCCGPGLHNIYEYLRDTGHAPEDPEIREQLRTEDPGAVIGRAGLARTCGLCDRALDIFTGILGAAAGNLALVVLATSGVYLGGGIPPKILPRLQERIFLDAFLDKGRFSPLLATFPVHVILNQRTALLGAAAHALGLLSR